MKRNFYKPLLSGFLVILFVGCTAPLFEVTDNEIEAGDEQEITQDQVKEAIMEAGKGIGWKMKDTEPGEIIGTYQSRKYSASVKIPYSPKEYSIFYKSSHGLRYNGVKIHKRYNELVKNLSAAIGRELAKTTGQAQPQTEEPTTMGGLMDWLSGEGSDDEEEEAAAASSSK